MKLVTTEQMRELDRLTITEAEVPGLELMRRAGQMVVHSLEGHFEWVLAENRPILVLAGKGNNAGDAFVAVHELLDRGHDAVTLVMLAEESELRGDARIAYRKMQEMQPNIIYQAGMKSLSTLEAALKSSTLVVDGILGTGTKGTVRGRLADIINVVNESRKLVLSIDIPSGLNGNEGVPFGVSVMATQVVTMGLPKVGLVKNRGLDYSSHIDVADIGIPFYYVEDLEAPAEMIVREEIREILPKRWNISHKGSYGHVLVLGGAMGFAGAPVMAGVGALRSGAGLVSVGVPASVYHAAASMRPELMVHALPDGGSGRMNGENLGQVEDLLRRCNVCVIGPGLTTDPEVASWLAKLLPKIECPVVLDADALNLVAEDRALLESIPGEVVITPHPGEMARLMGCTTKVVMQDRWAIAAKMKEDWKVTLVLKGAGTVVTSPSEAIWVNATGNPGMASGGTGDVLSGMIGGLIAQGLEVFDAAKAAVFLHGLAGDYAGYRESEYAMTAIDLLDSIREAFNTTLA